MGAKAYETMTFEWKSNEDCTDLTCHLPEEYYLRVEQMDEGSWWWDCCHEMCGTIDPNHRLKGSLLYAMRAAQSAYMKHKTPTP